MNVNYTSVHICASLHDQVLISKTNKSMDEMIQESQKETGIRSRTNTLVLKL